MQLRVWVGSALVAAMTSGSVSAMPAHKPRHRPRQFVATAYCKDGETQSGIQTHPGIVAADPHVLPTGSVVRIDGLRMPRDTYVVEDRGVRGRHVDIFMRSCRAAKRFGRRRVLLRVIRIGDGQRLRSDGR